MAQQQTGRDIEKMVTRYVHRVAILLGGRQNKKLFSHWLF